MIPIMDILPPRTRPVATTSLIAAYVAAHVVSFEPMDASRTQLIVELPFLWIFGANVEDRLGRGRFVLLYLAGAALEGTMHRLLTGFTATALLPASGGIAVVLGAYLLLFPRSRVLMLIPVPLALVETPAIIFFGFWLSLQVALAIRHGSARAAVPTLALQVALWIVGAALCWMLRRQERLRVEWWAP